MKIKQPLLLLKLPLRNLATILIIAFFITHAVTAKPLPLKIYRNLPFVSQVKLSPNGNTVAMVKNSKGTLVLTILKNTATYNFVTGIKKVILQADNIEVLLNWYVWGIVSKCAYPT